MISRVTHSKVAGVKVYTGQEIAQGAKTGQWEALNKKNGATFQPPALMPTGGR
jgi:hypothetical protein